MATFKSRSKASKASWTFPWTNTNIVGLGIGVAVILVGFILLYMGTVTSWDNPLSISVAPVVLVIGYCVIVPWAIMRKSTPKE
jgi:hypothetical protein